MSFRMELPGDMPASIMQIDTPPLTERVLFRSTLTVWKDRPLSRSAVQASAIRRHYCIRQDAVPIRTKRRQCLIRHLARDALGSQDPVQKSPLIEVCIRARASPLQHTACDFQHVVCRARLLRVARGRCLHMQKQDHTRRAWSCKLQSLGEHAAYLNDGCPELVLLAPELEVARAT